jgi:hypothetical protein
MVNLLKQILPREILTGENILNKAFPASVARFLCFKRITEVFLTFGRCNRCCRKDIKTDEAMDVIVHYLLLLRTRHSQRLKSLATTHE